MTQAKDKQLQSGQEHASIESSNKEVSKMTQAIEGQVTITLTQEQKEAYEKYLKVRAERHLKGQSRRAAMKELRKRHDKELLDLVAKEKAKRGIK